MYFFLNVFFGNVIINFDVICSLKNKRFTPKHYLSLLHVSTYVFTTSKYLIYTYIFIKLAGF